MDIENWLALLEEMLRLMCPLNCSIEVLGRMIKISLLVICCHQKCEILSSDLFIFSQEIGYCRIKLFIIIMYEGCLSID